MVQHAILLVTPVHGHKITLKGKRENRRDFLLNYLALVAIKWFCTTTESMWEVIITHKNLYPSLRLCRTLLSWACVKDSEIELDPISDVLIHALEKVEVIPEITP